MFSTNYYKLFTTKDNKIQDLKSGHIDSHNFEHYLPCNGTDSSHCCLMLEISAAPNSWTKNIDFNLFFFLSYDSLFFLDGGRGVYGQYTYTALNAPLVHEFPLNKSFYVHTLWLLLMLKMTGFFCSVFFVVLFKSICNNKSYRKLSKWNLFQYLN